MNIVPSIEMIPAKYSPGILLCQEPMDGSGDFSVTRATNVATRFNAAGFIETVTSGLPRLDYYTSSGTPGCPALLVEPSGSNSVLRSQDFSATWTVGVSATVTGVTSPDGTSNATTFISDGTTNRVRQSVSLVSGTTYTYSLFGKFGSLSSGFTMNVFEENATTYGSGVCQAFNLNEGTLGASGSVGAGFTLQSVGMENYGNGWYRCRMTVLMGYTTPSGALGGKVGFRIGTEISGGRPLSVVSGTVSAWGAQLETGSVATSYIPTTTGSVTRDGDVIIKTGVSGLIGQTEGTMYAEFDVAFNNRNTDIISLDSSGTQNGFFMTIRNSGLVQLIVRQSTTNALIFQRTGAIPVGINKVAIAYKNGDFAISLNGTAAQVDTTSITMPSVAISRATIGLGQLYSLDQSVRVRSAAIYKTRLPNYLLESATSQIESYSSLASSLSYSIV